MGNQEPGKTLAYVYAEALYDVASDAGRINETEEELNALAAAVHKDEILRRFLDVPTITPQQKRRVLQTALNELSQPMLNFISLVISHRRVNLLERIAEAFHDHSNLRAGIAEFTLQSARPMETEEVARLREVLSQGLQRKIVLREKVRPELLGGIVLSHADRQWDTSISRRLKRLVTRLEAGKEVGNLWQD